MSTVFLIDTVGDARAALAQAASAAGWRMAPAALGADAIVLATDAAGLAPALRTIAEARHAGAAVALVADLDRSGWDRLFGAGQAADVDALFGKPVDAGAVFRRLDGIMASRASAWAPPGTEMAAILARAIVNEETAAAFYRQAATRASDAVTREALEELMRDEVDHKHLIEEFRSGARPLPEGRTPGGSLAESLGTPDFTADMSPADAFLLAARKEKLAVEFYENWAQLYPEGAERHLLLSLAEIERRHKVKVEDLFTNAAFPEAW